jgi:hypothetical protein
MLLLRLIDLRTRDMQETLALAADYDMQSFPIQPEGSQQV